MNPLEIADVLDKAHDELLVRGWKQHTFTAHGDDGPVCAETAIGIAANAPLSGPMRLNVKSWLAGKEVAGDVGREWLYQWNDDPERTIDDVLDAFRITAKRLREQAS